MNVFIDLLSLNCFYCTIHVIFYTKFLIFLTVESNWINGFNCHVKDIKTLQAFMRFWIAFSVLRKKIVIYNRIDI